MNLPFSVGQLFLDDDFHRFNQLLSKHPSMGNISRPNRNTLTTIGNVWLVYIKQILFSNDPKILAQIFEKSHLRMDSLVFVFSDGTKGKLFQYYDLHQNSSIKNYYDHYFTDK